MQKPKVLQSRARRFGVQLKFQTLLSNPKIVGPYV